MELSRWRRVSRGILAQSTAAASAHRLGHSFLRVESSAIPSLQRRFSRSLRSSIAPVSMGCFCGIERKAGAPGRLRSMPFMKYSSSSLYPVLVRSHASGHFRRPAAHRRSAFRTPLPEQVWAPLQNARLGTWEPGSLLGLRQWVTRPIREFKTGDFTMYLSHFARRISRP